MAYVKKTALDNFDNIRGDIEKGFLYFKKNYKVFNDFIRFVFKSSLTPADLSVNQELQKPNMEWPILPAFISRLCGEFSKMDPGFSVRAKEGVKLINPDVIMLVEAHLKAAFMGGNTNQLSYHLYRNLLAGGFDVAKIYTDYADEKSFDQKIYIEPVFDPTLTVFDPLARKSHKGDGRFACELFPKSAEEAVELYGSDILKDVQFTRDSSVAEFNWSYRNQKEDILLFGEYFRKRTKKTKILKLANGHVLTEKSYEDFLSRWEQAGIIEQAPIVIKSRMTDIQTIDMYTITGTKIVDYKETNFSMLPLVFFDGNSIIVRDNENSQAEQVVRPYVYHAKDAQKMKNFAGQSLCNEIENLVQHKWTAPVEGIPANKDYQLAYTDPQKATVVLYNQFKDGDPNQPLNPPREIMRPPIPPELANTFNMADNTVQVILGSYDAALGANENDISGIAIMQGAMHSNAAAMPYTTGFIHGWARCAEIYLDLLPKYYVTPRTIPVILPNGKRDFYEVNKRGNMKFDYDVSALEVTIEPGVNYEVQKQIALKTITALMGVSESFKEFMNQNGLEVLLDNIDIRGIEKLRYMVQEWMDKQKELADQAAQKNANMPTPEQIAGQQVQVEASKVEMQREGNQLKAQVEMAKANSRDAVANKEADIKFLEVMSTIQDANLDRALDQERLDAENARTAVEMSTKFDEHLMKRDVHEKGMNEPTNQGVT
ncbi:MAG TPA: hypothetical protein VJ279_08485 [Hanamia sp.]|jgi:hypothetical protein|nr:hypothetical protein [Hanamia sp.]